jgi:hypothetical protein
MNKSGATLRYKLYDYIRVADNKKLQAIYHLLEDEIEQANNWWKDKKFVQELDNRHQALETGADSGFTTSQLIQSIDKLRTKKYDR